MPARTPRSSRQEPTGGDDELVAVTVEPKEGRSDREITVALRRAGASEVEALAPGFISAIVPSSRIDQLRLMAEVHPKVRKKMR